MKHVSLSLVVLGLVILGGVVLAQLQQQAQDNRAENAQRAPVKIPDPVACTSPDGKVKGWKMTIAGCKALATPALVDGKVFVGGGFGSHEFYAFDAATGKKLWQYQTADDGPTAAVVAEGY